MVIPVPAKHPIRTSMTRRFHRPNRSRCLSRSLRAPHRRRGKNHRIRCRRWSSNP